MPPHAGLHDILPNAPAIHGDQRDACATPCRRHRSFASGVPPANHHYIVFQHSFSLYAQCMIKLACSR